MLSINFLASVTNMYLFKVMLVMADVRTKKIIESTMEMPGCWPNTLWKVLVERTMHYPCKVKKQSVIATTEKLRP